MGWRIVSLGFDEDPSEAVLEWAKQFCAFADWCGAEPGSEFRKQDGAHLLEIQFDANSSYLDWCTPHLCEAAATIARDIDDEDTELAEIAAAVKQQLTQQIVRRDPDQFVTPTRSGREASERLGGEASIPVLLQELALHQARVEDDLRAIDSASGPTAWRTRLDCEFEARVDALAVVRTARRVERVAADLRDRLRDPHLAAALRDFKRVTRHVADIRNIAEHVEDYAVGRGRLDKDAANVEPGEVIRVTLENNDVLVSARGRSVSSGVIVQACERLATCVDATVSARYLGLAFPKGLDFDFMVVESDGTTRTVTELNDEQKSLKTALADARKRANTTAVDRGVCPACGLKL